MITSKSCYFIQQKIHNNKSLIAIKRLFLPTTISNSKNFSSNNNNNTNNNNYIFKRKINTISSSSNQQLSPEKLIEEITKTFSLKSIFDKESRVIDSYFIKLAGSGHPILDIARDFYEESNKENANLLQRNRSTLVQLITKSVSANTIIPSNYNKEGSSHLIDEKQKSLSEITELIYAAQIIHRTVVDIRHKSGSTEKSPLHHGNKLATLMGDFLLAKSCKGLASLRNSRVTELMSDSIADFTESVFIGSSTDLTTNFEQLYNYENWVRRTDLAIGSLLAHSSYCSMLFNEFVHDEGHRNLAYLIGRKFGPVLQISKELKFFEEGSEHLESHFDLWFLPVIYHLNKGPLGEYKTSSGFVNYSKIYQEIKTSQKTLAKTRATLDVHKKEILVLISKIEPSTYSKLLKDFLFLI